MTSIARRATGGASTILGLVSFVVAIVVVFALPGSYAERSTEPEDLYGVAFWFVLCGVIGVVSLAMGILLLRASSLAPRKAKGVALLGFISAVPLAAAAMLGLATSSAQSLELTLLALPAAILVAAAVQLWRCPSRPPG